MYMIHDNVYLLGTRKVVNSENKRRNEYEINYFLTDMILDF